MAVRDMIAMFEEGTNIVEYTKEETPEEFLERLYKVQSFIRNELRIVLIGKTGSGKSATANTILGQKKFESSPSGESITAKCQSAGVKYGKRSVLLVDTPGMFDTGISNDKTSKEIMKCVTITSPGIHAVILVTKIGRFTKEEKNTVKRFKEVLGDDLKHYMIIVFTGKDDLDEHNTNVENYVRQGPPELQDLVAECGGRIIALNNRAGKEEKEKVKSQIFGMIDEMVSKNGGRCYTTEMYQRAEAMMKKREYELRVKIDEETRAEKETIKKRLSSWLDEHDTQLLKNQSVKNTEDIEEHNMKFIEHDDQLEEMQTQLEQLKVTKEKELKEKEEEQQSVRDEFETHLDSERQMIEQLEGEEGERVMIEETENIKAENQELVDKPSMKKLKQELGLVMARLDGTRTTWGNKRDEEDDDYNNFDDYEFSYDENVIKELLELREKLLQHKLENEEKARWKARMETEEESGFFAFIKKQLAKKLFLTGIYY